MLKVRLICTLLVITVAVITFVSTDTAIRILTPKRSLLYGSHPRGLTP